MPFSKTQDFEILTFYFSYVELETCWEYMEDATLKCIDIMNNMVELINNKPSKIQIHEDCNPFCLLNYPTKKIETIVDKKTKV